MRVVPGFDVFEDGPGQLCPGVPSPPVQELELEGAEERMALAKEHRFKMYEAMEMMRRTPAAGGGGERSWPYGRSPAMWGGRYPGAMHPYGYMHHGPYGGHPGRGMCAAGKSGRAPGELMSKRREEMQRHHKAMEDSLARIADLLEDLVETQLEASVKQQN